jgi:hypothetical protein
VVTWYFVFKWRSSTELQSGHLQRLRWHGPGSNEQRMEIFELRTFGRDASMEGREGWQDSKTIGEGIKTGTILRKPNRGYP